MSRERWVWKIEQVRVKGDEVMELVGGGRGVVEREMRESIG